MWFAFSVDNGSASLKRIYEVLRDLLYKGRLRRPAIYHTFPNRVTPNGVGQLHLFVQYFLRNGKNPVAKAWPPVIRYP